MVIYTQLYYMYPSKNFTYIGQVEINSNVLTIYLSDASKCFCFLVFNISVNIYFSPIKEREGEGGGGLYRAYSISSHFVFEMYVSKT